MTQFATSPIVHASSEHEHEVRNYEDQLSGDLRWALIEGSKHFEDRSAVQFALRRIAKRLGDFGIPYAVAGAMALFRHGYRRFTEDVNILVTRHGLREIHRKLIGKGYHPNSPQSKALRDTELGVRIEFILTGDYPGDGKPKPVAFPDPAAVGVEKDGIQFVDLKTLIELKLASGMTSSDRLKDLADVQEAIKSLGLSRDFAQSLNPYVREKFNELWTVPDSEWPEQPRPEHE